MKLQRSYAQCKFGTLDLLKKTSNFSLIIQWCSSYQYPYVTGNSLNSVVLLEFRTDMELLKRVYAVWKYQFVPGFEIVRKCLEYLWFINNWKSCCISVYVISYELIMNFKLLYIYKRNVFVIVPADCVYWAKYISLCTKLNVGCKWVVVFMDG